MTQCLICAGPESQETPKTIPYPGALQKPGLWRPQGIAFCQSCGAGLAYPMPTDRELEDIYSQGEFWKASRSEVLAIRKYPLMYGLAKTRWELIESFLSLDRSGREIKILDIGSGHGFLGIVAARSVKCNLIEYAVIEKEALLNESLKRTWGKYFPDKKLTFLDSLKDINTKFQVIVLSHVLEHVTDPEGLLTAVRERLADGGIVFIDIPNRDYLFKKDVYPHVLFFDQESLGKLCRRIGLEVLMIDSFGLDMKRSPLGFHRRTDVLTLTATLLYKIRKILPAGFLVAFFNWYYGVSSKNPDGTWLRAMCTIPRKS